MENIVIPNEENLKKLEGAIAKAGKDKRLPGTRRDGLPEMWRGDAGQAQAGQATPPALHHQHH